MTNSRKVPKYAHLEYQVLHELEISIPEYFLLDMVHRLSRSGWCNKRLDNIASDMRMTRRGVVAMRDRLIERGLLKKGIANRLRTSEKVNSMYFLDDDELPKSALISTKSALISTKSAKSSPKNNNRLTRELGYKDFQAAAYERMRRLETGRSL